VATGFDDLDELTAGFQPGDLVIVAARPSMGKTAFWLNVAQHAAISRKKPSPSSPWRCRRSRWCSGCSPPRRGSTRAACGPGGCEDDDYPRLATAAGHLNTAPIYIDDTPGISVLEMRAKARRLKPTART
jgi:replicative DNA helicase